MKLMSIFNAESQTDSAIFEEQEMGFNLLTKYQNLKF